MDKINQIMKTKRLQKGYTMEEMALKLGYKDKSSYWHLENGKINIKLEQAKQLSKILDINLDFFWE